MTAFPVTSVLWKGHVQDGPVPVDNFIVSEGTETVNAELKEGAVLVQLLYLSVDPYMRGRMRDMKVRRSARNAFVALGPSCRTAWTATASPILAASTVRLQVTTLRPDQSA